RSHDEPSARPGELHGRTGALTTTATFETVLWGLTPASRCGTRPTPPTVGLAPRPVTEESPSNPKESVLDCTHIDGATKKRPLRPDDRVQTNRSRRGRQPGHHKSARGSRFPRRRPGRSPSPSWGRARRFALPARRHGEVSEAPRPTFPQREGTSGKAVLARERVRARPRKAVWCRSVSERDAVKRTIPKLRARQSPDAKGLETNNATLP